METLELRFIEIDFWGRPIYISNPHEVYICSVDIIFPDKNIAPNGTKEEINKYFRNNLDKLVIFGKDLDEDPLGTKIGSKWNIKIID